MNPLQTGDIYAHVQTVCTSIRLRGEWPGDEASMYLCLYPCFLLVVESLVAVEL